MFFIIYFCIIFFLFCIGPWITFKIYGETNHLGLFIFLCRRHKFTRWLSWNVWGNDDWYFEAMGKRIDEWQQWKKVRGVS